MRGFNKTDKATILASLVIMISLPLSAQSIYYSEVSTYPTMTLNEKWTAEGYFGLKRLHEREDDGYPEWQRVNLGLRFDYHLMPWRFTGGFRTQYTYEEEFDNYFEIRPFIGVMLSIPAPLLKNLLFRQRYIIEWRNLFYSDSENNDSFFRARYKLELIYGVFRNMEKKRELKVAGSLEAYQLKVSGKSETYAASWEYTAKAIYTFSNRADLILGYTYESFSQLVEENPERGNSFFVEYNFRIEKKGQKNKSPK